MRGCARHPNQSGEKMFSLDMSQLLSGWCQVPPSTLPAVGLAACHGVHDGKGPGPPGEAQRARRDRNSTGSSP